MVKRAAVAGLFVFAASLAGGTSAALANDSGPFSLGLKAGVTYDDNVVLQQLDTKTGIGDSSANLEAIAGYKLVDTKTDKLSIGYDFSQSLHAKLKNFDIQNHNISLTGSTQFEGATLGSSYSFYHLLLAGQNFLDLHLINPSVLAPISPHLFVRGAYLYMDTSFLTAASKPRSASHHQPEMQIFYFFDNSRASVIVGGDYEFENANGAEFSYKGYALTATLQLPLDVFSSEGKLKASYTYLSHDYDNITPSIGVRRSETRSTVKLGAGFRLIDNFTISVDYQYIDRSSNLPTANYTENMIGTTVRYDF